MIIFIKILLAHILGDFLLQPKSWVIEKEKKKAASPKLYFHVLIHGILVMVFAVISGNLVFTHNSGCVF